MKISYAMATINRPEGYLHSTIESLSQSGFFLNQRNLPLRLVVGSPDSSYLARYRTVPDQFQIEEMTVSEAEDFGLEKLWGTQRCALTHSRCLLPRGRSAGAEAVLYMQDDIVFSLGWQARLDSIVADLVQKRGRSWVLSLYMPGSKEPLDRYRRGEKWFLRQIEPTTAFYGCQAVLYPVEIATAFIPYLLENNVRRYVKPDDHLLPDFLKERGIPIVSTTPCLVQHMGQHSAGVCGVFHQSESFLPVVQ